MTDLQMQAAKLFIMHPIGSRVDWETQYRRWVVILPDGEERRFEYGTLKPGAEVPE